MTKRRISIALRLLVRERAQGCCEYCLSQESHATQGFSIEHIHPFNAGGGADRKFKALFCAGASGAHPWEPPRTTRYLLTLKGRPPFRLAGMETYERLQNVARLRLDLLATRYEARLAQLYQGLQSALSPFAQTYQECRQGAAWPRDIAYIL